MNNLTKYFLLLIVIYFGCHTSSDELAMLIPSFEKELLTLLSAGIQKEGYELYRRFDYKDFVQPEIKKKILNVVASFREINEALVLEDELQGVFQEDGMLNIQKATVLNRNGDPYCHELEKVFEKGIRLSKEDLIMYGFKPCNLFSKSW